MSITKEEIEKNLEQTRAHNKAILETSTYWYDYVRENELFRIVKIEDHTVHMVRTTMTYESTGYFVGSNVAKLDLEYWYGIDFLKPLTKTAANHILTMWLSKIKWLIADGVKKIANNN